LRAGIAACILLPGPGKHVGNPGELGSESMIESPKGEERTYGLWFGNRPDAARNDSAPHPPMHNRLRDIRLGELEFLDAVPRLPNRLLNQDCLRPGKFS
jgi:hypothetical protein